MKKLILAVSILSMLLVGCGNNKQIIDNNKNSSESNQVEVIITKENIYPIIGKIIKFENDKVHILSGDIVEIYPISKENSKKLYLGETVTLSLNGDTYNIETYIIEDFLTRFTTMGDKIESITGEVIISVIDSITIKSKTKEFTFPTNEAIFAEVGNIVTVDYFQLGENKHILEIYNETHKFTATVISIKRGDDGSFIVSFGEESEVTHIGTLNSSLINFNMSELKTGDKLDLYSEIMTMSYPAQFAPKKAIKNN